MSNEEDLLKKISEALSRDDEEVSISSSETDGKVTQVFMKRKPSGEPQWYVGEEGKIVVDWKEKFARKEQGKFPPFESGEYVLVSGIVKKDLFGLYRIHVMADERYADNFFVNEIPGQDPLKDYTCMPLEVIVEVVEERKQNYRISDIWNYDARFVKIVEKPLENPNGNEIKALKGKRVIIKGKFIEFEESSQDRFLKSLGYPNGSYIVEESSSTSARVLTIQKPNGEEVKEVITDPPEGYDDDETSGIVETPEGRRIKIEMPTGRIRFSGGVLENLYDDAGGELENLYNNPKTPMFGDAVKISTCVQETGELAVYYYDPCYLDVPSEERAKEYSNLRKEVGTKISKTQSLIEKNKYSKARPLIGELRTLELTENELDLIRDIVHNIPESEKPIQMQKSKSNPKGKRNHWVKDIDYYYNTRLESMTIDEFVGFAEQALSGHIKSANKYQSPIDLLIIAEEVDIPKEALESLAINCIENKLRRIEEKLHNDDEWEYIEGHYIGQVLMHLADIGTESSSQKVFEYIRGFVKDGYFWHIERSEENRNKRLPHFLSDATHALKTFVSGMPSEVLLSEKHYLKELKGFLEEHADEQASVSYINRVLGYIEERC